MGEVEESVAGVGPAEVVAPAGNGVKHWSFVSAVGGIYSCPDGAENEVRDRIEKAIERVFLPMDKDGIRLLRQTFSKEEITPQESQAASAPVEPGR